MMSLYTTGHLREVLKNVDIVSTLLNPSLYRKDKKTKLDKIISLSVKEI